MLKAHLGNEFGDPASKEYRARQEAFDAYNSLIEKAPRAVANIMSQLALDETVDRRDRLASTIERTALNVLDATNHGTQIGIALPARETTWAQIFEDEGHKQAAMEYQTLQDTAAQSFDAISACRKRGLEALKVVASTHVNADEHHHTLPDPLHSRAA